MAEKSRLDVLGPERLSQQGILPQVNLSDRQVVDGMPVFRHLAQLCLRQWTHR